MRKNKNFLILASLFTTTAALSLINVKDSPLIGIDKDKWQNLSSEEKAQILKNFDKDVNLIVKGVDVGNIDPTNDFKNHYLYFDIVQLKEETYLKLTESKKFHVKSLYVDTLKNWVSPSPLVFVQSLDPKYPLKVINVNNGENILVKD